MWIILSVFASFAVAQLAQGAIDNRQRPDSNLISALDGIIANDELKCIPRLMCERAAGGQPGQLRALQFDTSSLASLMQNLGLDAGGIPMFEIGRAITTGLSNRGDSYACYKQYPACPRDHTRLLYYLNNHRGGFFRGFSRPYYGKDQSRTDDQTKTAGQLRIVNQAFSSNAIQSEDDIYNHQSFLQEEPSFKFPLRSGKQLHFLDTATSKRQPSRFSFPTRELDDVYITLGQRHQFFPLN